MKQQSIIQILPFVFAACAASLNSAPAYAEGRVYTEIRIASPLDQMMAEDPHAGMMLGMADKQSAGQSQEPAMSWKLPGDWAEKPGDGMRVASFYQVDHPDSIDVSIVSLGRMQDLEGNLKRWIAQIDLEPSEANVEALIKSVKEVTIQSGETAKVYDFNQLFNNQSAENKSMMVATIDLPDSTVFVKMTGSGLEVFNNQKAFLAFCESLDIKK